MEPQYKGLDKNKYKLVTFDPRGFGKSRPPERDFPLDFYRRDAKDAADLMAVSETFVRRVLEENCTIQYNTIQ